MEKNFRYDEIRSIHRYWKKSGGCWQKLCRSCEGAGKCGWFTFTLTLSFIPYEQTLGTYQASPLHEANFFIHHCWTGHPDSTGVGQSIGFTGKECCKLNLVF